MAAINKMFNPNGAALNPVDALTERPFSYDSPFAGLRLPKGITEGTCALAIDIHGDGTANASLLQLQHLLTTLVLTCVEQGEQGLGGKWELVSGFVFLVVNPNTVDVAKTCMAPSGPRRMTVVDCVDQRLQQQFLPGPSNQQAHPLQLDFEPLPFRPDDSTQSEEPLDNDLLSLLLPDEPFTSTENTLSATGIKPSISGQPRIIRAIPRRSDDGRDRIQVQIGKKGSLVQGYWRLEEGVWIEHLGRSPWKTTGKWILMLGWGEATRFPIILPVWPGGEVWTPYGSTYTGFRRHPIAEAWIAENGVWQPLQGMAPPDSDWIKKGGWILLKGGWETVNQRRLPPL